MSGKVDLKKHFRKVYQSLPKSFQNLPLFVAVSSGLDSSVLAYLLWSLREELPPIYWLHVNYHLRGADSDREEAFLKKWATKVQIPFQVKSLYFSNTKAKEKSEKNLQNWAREQRYKFFMEAIQKETQGQGLLLTAHHQSDQVETLLSRLIMGSGLKALKGMEIWEENIHWHKKRLKIFRPFLTVPRFALEVYARLYSVQNCEDLSNQSLKYSRNRLRHEIWPRILQENPQAATALTQITKRAAAAYEALEPSARSWLKRYQIFKKKDREGSLIRSKVIGLSFGKRQIVLELFFRQFFTKTRNLGKSLQTVEACLDRGCPHHHEPLSQDLEWVLTPSQLLVRNRKEKFKS